MIFWCKHYKYAIKMQSCWDFSKFQFSVSIRLPTWVQHFLNICHKLEGWVYTDEKPKKSKNISIFLDFGKIVLQKYIVLEVYSILVYIYWYMKRYICRTGFGSILWRALQTPNRLFHNVQFWSSVTFEHTFSRMKGTVIMNGTHSLSMTENCWWMQISKKLAR